MNDSEYNGWKNYETWTTALHIGSEPYTYEESRLVASSGEEWQAADALKDWAEEVFILNEDGERPAGLAGDLLGSALSKVDWTEIVRNIRSEE